MDEPSSAEESFHIGGPMGRSRASFLVGGRYESSPGALPDARAVSEALGLEPTHAHNAGERPRSKRSNLAPYRHGMWILESALAPSSEPESHVRWLLDRVLPSRSKLLGILDSDSRLEATIHTGLDLTEWNQQFTLSPATLEDLGSLHCALWLDIYWDGNEEEVSRIKKLFDRFSSRSEPDSRAPQGPRGAGDPPQRNPTR